MVNSKPVYWGRVSCLPRKLLTSLSRLPRAGQFRPAPGDPAHSGTEWFLTAFSYSLCQSGAPHSPLPHPHPAQTQQELSCYRSFLGTCNSSNRNPQWEVWTNSTSVCSPGGSQGRKALCASCLGETLGARQPAAPKSQSRVTCPKSGGEHCSPGGL